MSKKCALLLFFIVVMVSGCASYRDINKTAFITATIIDVDEGGKPVVYAECFISNYSQIDNTERGIKTILVGRGATITEAIQKINQTSRQPISTVYSKMLIFTKKAAEHGIGDYLDVLMRDQEFLLRPFMTIYDGEPKEILELSIVQGDYMGLYLEDLFQNDKVTNIMRPDKLFDYINRTTCRSNIAVLGIIGIKEDEADPYIGIKEAAVLKENKLVDTLSEDEFKTYCVLDGKSKQTLLTIENPEDEKSKITLTAINASSKKSIQYDGKAGNVIHYKIEVNLRLTVNETQGFLDLEDQEIRKEMEEAVKDKIKEEGAELFNMYKIRGIDLFGAEEQLYRKYPHALVADVVGSTDLEIVINAHIEGSSNTQNSFE